MILKAISIGNNMPVLNELPDWFTSLALFALITLIISVIKVLWGRYTKLEEEVNTLKRELTERATFYDLQVMGDRARLDHITTQKRLDDIFTLITSIQPGS
jgi:hypothetical protein